MPPQVDNEVYHRLGDRWYEAWDDPIALLRAESRLRNPWILRELRESFGSGAAPRVLDLGCGAGFLSGYLAGCGLSVTGVDRSAESLAVASARDLTRTARYVQGEVTRLPFEDASFDAVCAMDLLEHVEDPALVIREASRVLAPGGLFFFHTFNRNLLSWLLVIQAVRWLVRNTPPNLHVLHLFIKPAELRSYCDRAGLEPREFRGVRPRVNTPFFRSFLSGTIDPGLEFEFCRSLSTGYSGIACKRRDRSSSQ
jgi:2-polyprenyl-6-hydroxyphenyl methylase/3-demethylubiquinone-9 3-methyltransferase